MAIKLIDDSPTDLPEVPWITDWTRVKANDGAGFIVQCLLVGNKGLIVATNDFKVMVWKSQGLHNAILEHIGSAYDTASSNDSLVVVVKAKTKALHQFGFDDSEKGHWVSTGRIYQFFPLAHTPSDALIPEVMSGVAIDSSPKTGRKAS